MPKIFLKVRIILFFMVPMVIFSCGGRKFIISSEGLSFISLGDQIPLAGTRRFHGIAIEDSVFMENGFTWRASVMKYNNGKIFLEEDFYDPGVLSRIRIETPNFYLKNGVAVGDSVGRLQAIKGEWYCVPMPAFRLFDVYNSFFPRTHFVVRAPGRDLNERDYHKHPFSEFDPKERIIAIAIY